MVGFYLCIYFWRDGGPSVDQLLMAADSGSSGHSSEQVELNIIKRPDEHSYGGR